MRVYLIQHGQSKPEEEDPQRRLTAKGIGEVQNVAEFLRPLKLAVDAIWHSDKARAQQTGELLAEAILARDRVVQREGLGPKDQVATTKEALEQNRPGHDDRWPPPISRQTHRVARHRQRRR